MEYLHNEKNEQHLTLHDCRADRVELNDGVLSFWFTEGFWVTSGHPGNSTGKTVRTDAARVDFVLRNSGGDDVCFDLFTSLRKSRALRKSLSLTGFLKLVNRRGWGLEFLYQYPGYWSRIIECVLCLPKKPYWKESQLKLDVSEVIYRWNNLCPEKEW